MNQNQFRTLRDHLLAAMIFPAFCVAMFCPDTASATVNLLEVNHVTRQLHVFDEDDYEGLFWETTAGEDYLWRKEEAKYLALGYEYTDSPHVLDWAALFAICTGATVALVLRVIRKRRRDV